MNNTTFNNSDSISRFTNLNRLDDHSNNLKSVKSSGKQYVVYNKKENTFEFFSYDTTFKKMTRFFERLWKPKSKRSENVKNDILFYFNNNLKENLSSIDIKQLNAIKTTLEIVNCRWENQFKKELEEIKEIINKKTDESPLVNQTPPTQEEINHEPDSLNQKPSKSAPQEQTEPDLKDQNKTIKSPSDYNPNIDGMQQETLIQQNDNISLTPDKKHFSANSIKNGFRDFLKDQIKDQNQLNTLNQAQENVESELKDLVWKTRIAANVFNDTAFSGKIYEKFNIEGPGSYRAVWSFVEALAGYYESIQGSLNDAQKENFKEIIEAYYTFQLSTLIKSQIKISKNENQAEWIKLGEDILHQDMLKVKNGEKKRGYWIAGSNDHFVPLRYENKKENNQNKFIMGTFDLGEGIIDTSKISNGKIQPENCIPEFNDADLKSFCQQVVNIAGTKNLDDWKKYLYNLINNNPTNANDRLNKSVPQLLQKSGNCTCRGQLALLRNEFDRLFEKNKQVNYTNFKNYFHNQILESIKPSQKIVISLGADEINQKKELNKEDVFNLGWIGENHLSSKRNKFFERINKRFGGDSNQVSTNSFELTFPCNYKMENSITFSLTTLFKEANKIIIGRKPDAGLDSLDENTNYFEIPINDTLISEKAISIKKENGKILVTAETDVTIARSVKGKDIHEKYQKGQSFELTFDIATIEFSNFVINLRPPQQKKI